MRIHSVYTGAAHVWLCAFVRALVLRTNMRARTHTRLIAIACTAVCVRRCAGPSAMLHPTLMPVEAPGWVAMVAIAAATAVLVLGASAYFRRVWPRASSDNMPDIVCGEDTLEMAEKLKEAITPFVARFFMRSPLIQTGLFGYVSFLRERVMQIVTNVHGA